MKEKKICSFTQNGYRLQLLKITETSVNGYYQIRENRRIKATFTTLDAAIRKFYVLQGNKMLQKEIPWQETEETVDTKKNNKDEIPDEVHDYTGRGRWQAVYYITKKQAEQYIKKLYHTSGPNYKKIIAKYELPIIASEPEIPGYTKIIERYPNRNEEYKYALL